MAIAHVRSAAGEYTSTTSATATLSGTTSNNNLIIVAVMVTDGATTINTPTDNSGGGNTYTPCGAQLAGAVSVSRVWYAKNVTGATGFAVTATLANAAFGWIVVHEVSGADTSAPLDQYVNNPQTSTGTGTDAITSTAKTTTANGEYIFGAEFEDNFNTPTVTEGTGFTVGETMSGNTFAKSEYQVQTSQGSIAATFTHNTSGSTVTHMATFKAAGGTTYNVSLNAVN